MAPITVAELMHQKARACLVHQSIPGHSKRIDLVTEFSAEGKCTTMFEVYNGSEMIASVWGLPKAVEYYNNINHN
jgi:hypothetical protein